MLDLILLPFQIIFILVLAIFTGVLSKMIAGKKGYEGYFWTGFLLSVVGLIYVAGLPLSEQMREKELREMIEKLRGEGVVSDGKAPSDGSAAANSAIEPPRGDFHEGSYASSVAGAPRDAGGCH